MKDQEIHVYNSQELGYRVMKRAEGIASLLPWINSMILMVPGLPADVRKVEFLSRQPNLEALRKIIEPRFERNIAKATARKLGAKAMGEHAYLEHVNVLFEGHRCDMFVDEQGMLYELSRNDEATTIYRAAYMAQHPDHDPEGLPYIAGTAVLFRDRVWF